MQSSLNKINSIKFILKEKTNTIKGLQKINQEYLEKTMSNNENDTYDQRISKKIELQEIKIKELQTENSNKEIETRILKDNISNIDKSLEITLRENEDLIFKHEDELKIVQNKLEEAISNNNLLYANYNELTNK